MKKKLFLALACIVFFGVVVLGVSVVKQKQKETAQKEKVLQEQESLEQAKEDEKKNIKNHATEWEKSALTSPTAGSLKAAGTMKITWNGADSLGEVSGYKVYVDNQLVESTDAKTTTCTYYSTEVTKHTIYVEADMKNGSVLNSDVNTFFVNKKFR